MRRIIRRWAAVAASHWWLAIRVGVNLAYYVSDGIVCMPRWTGSLCASRVSASGSLALMCPLGHFSVHPEATFSVHPDATTMAFRL